MERVPGIFAWLPLVIFALAGFCWFVGFPGNYQERTGYEYNFLLRPLAVVLMGAGTAVVCFGLARWFRIQGKRDADMSSLRGAKGRTPPPLPRRPT